jgi:WD40 repeat protein
MTTETIVLLRSRQGKMNRHRFSPDTDSPLNRHQFSPRTDFSHGVCAVVAQMLPFLLSELVRSKGGRCTAHPGSFQAEVSTIITWFSLCGEKAIKMSTLLACGLLLTLTPSFGTQEPKERMILKGNTDPVRAPYEFESIAFSHDGKTVLTFGTGGVKLWDSALGMVKQTLKTKLAPYTVAFSPDDKLVAVGAGAYGHGDIEVWKVATGEQVWQQRDVSGHFVVPVVFSADGKNLISPEDSTWARHASQQREPLPIRGVLTFWDAGAGKRCRTIEGGASAAQMVLSDDGRFLLTATFGSSSRIELRDVPSGKVMGEVNFEQQGIITIHLAPDKTAAVGLRDRVEFWDVARGKLLRTIKTGETYRPAFARPLSFSADGRLLASALENEVKLWDVQTGALKGNLPLAKTFCLALSPDGHTLATTNRDGMVRLWEVAKVIDRK